MDAHLLKLRFFEMLILTLFAKNELFHDILICLDCTLTMTKIIALRCFVIFLDLLVRYQHLKRYRERGERERERERERD